MKKLVLLLFILAPFIGSSQKEPSKGMFFSFIPSHPFSYFETDRTEVHEYPNGEYEKWEEHVTYHEFRPRRGLDLNAGYNFSNYFGLGVYTRIGADMLDVDGLHLNVGGIITSKPLNFMSIQGKVGWLNDRGYNQNSLCFGGALNFYFPGGTDRFDFGIRTGLLYTHFDREHSISFVNPLEYDTTTTSIDWYLIELGIFFMFHK